MTATILWLRQDLRLCDNEALYQACLRDASLIPLYILDTTSSNSWKMGEAQQWWLHHSLKSLELSFKEKGLKLIFRQGNPLNILKELQKETQATALYWNRCYTPYALERDNRIKAYFEEQGLDVKNFNSSLLFEPWTVLNKKQEPYKVFSHFWKACRLREISDPSQTPPRWQSFDQDLASEKVEDWSLLPKLSWADGFAKEWRPGEKEALERLDHFLQSGALQRYKEDRNRPDYEGSSKLSPHLHFGEIGPRQIWSRLHQTIEPSEGQETYLREIGWREFCTYLLYHFPTFPDHPFRPEFAGLKWQNQKNSLHRWQKGQTGYPIVDAGMRQMWYTGWMHNRVRMITASFLCKHLLIDWVEGEKWFWNTLVDADLASNAVNWQWIAGSGVDASPYFRIFNPVLQGKKFDPSGDYVRTWVPELKDLPNAFIHQPWTASEDVLKKAGLILGKNYPRPIVDHSKARQIALASYHDIKENSKKEKFHASL